MISKEYLDPVFAYDAAVTENSPVVYALFKLGVAQKSASRYARQLALTQSKMAPFARANGEQEEFVISMGDETATLKELASQMSPKQLETWLSEVPGMVDAARHPQAPGVSGEILSAVTGAMKLAGAGDFALSVMLRTSALRWRDDQRNQHTVSVHAAGEGPFDEPQQKPGQEKSKKPRGM